MASSKKLIINNLTIVWQGQSWSVITPDGIVKARFPDKNDAVRYAEQTLDFKERKISLDELMPVIMNGEEFAFDLPVPESKTKLKNDELVKQKHSWLELIRDVGPPVLAVIVFVGLIVVLGHLAIQSFQVAAREVQTVGENILDHILFKLAVVITVAVLAFRFVTIDLEDGQKFLMYLKIALLLALVAACQATGILAGILDWLI